MEELASQALRRLSPELDPLRLGSGWTMEDLSKPQILIESTAGDSHPGSVHLGRLTELVKRGFWAPAGSGQGMPVPISATGRARAQTASTTALPAGK